MTWAISVSGSREGAKEHVDLEARRQIDLGYMTTAQHDMLKQVMDAHGGNRVSINASGHNNATGGASSISINTYEHVEEKAPDTPQAGESQVIDASEVGRVEDVVGTSSAVVGGPQ